MPTTTLETPLAPAANLSALSPDDIYAMSYNELIGIVRETNRTPGGNLSVFHVSNRTRLDGTSVVLDIGTSTGSTAIELARLTGCTVFGIDKNETSLEEARRRAASLGLRRVHFQQQDATDLDFVGGTFDMVFCGNVTSLITNPERAFAEYLRVLREGGYLAAIPMYYLEEPSEELVEKVRHAIQVPIKVQYRSEATGFFSHESIELYSSTHFRFDALSEERVAGYVETMLAQPHLLALHPPARDALRDVYSEYMQLFRENLSLMGYTILIARKSAFVEDELLFTARPIG